MTWRGRAVTLDPTECQTRLSSSRAVPAGPAAATVPSVQADLKVDLGLHGDLIVMHDAGRVPRQRDLRDEAVQ